ncbi:MAG: putative glycoside hydrolase [Gemmatimonadota bacterium]
MNRLRAWNGLAAATLLAGVFACEQAGRAADAQSTGAGGTETAPPAAGAAPAAKVRPDSVRALYVNAWAAGSRSRMSQLIRIADSTEINAFIIDIKESDTYLTYAPTAIALAREIGADRRPASTWLPELVDTLASHGIHAIARIVVFKDRQLAERRPDLAIRHTSGGVWRDNKGIAWVNPYDERVWEYNVAIAAEALEMGFAEVQWDYVRFPDVTERARSTMTFPGHSGKSRADNIRDFILYSKSKLQKYSVPVTADVFGLVTHLEDDVGIGQQWEKVIAAADVVLPMVYPSHYYRGQYGFERPLANPYEIVRMAVTDAVERTNWLRDSAGVEVGEVMPWLEAMSIRGASYGPAELREQIAAVHDAGAASWALWNPGSRFEAFVPALRRADGSPSPLERSGWRSPVWSVPRQRLSRLVTRRDRARAADSTGKETPPAGPAAR